MSVAPFPSPPHREFHQGCVTEGDLSKAMLLLETFGPTVLHVHKKDELVFRHSCAAGHAKIVQWFLTTPAITPTYISICRHHALHYAILHGHVGVVQVLLEYDAHTRKIYDYGRKKLRTVGVEGSCHRYPSYGDLFIQDDEWHRYLEPIDPTRMALDTVDEDSWLVDMWMAVAKKHNRGELYTYLRELRDCVH